MPFVSVVLPLKNPSEFVMFSLFYVIEFVGDYYIGFIAILREINEAKR